MAEQEVIVENLPFQINLGLPQDPRNTIGRAQILKNDNGSFELKIHIFEEGAVRMNSFIEEVNLYEVGFAGILKNPPKWTS